MNRAGRLLEPADRNGAMKPPILPGALFTSALSPATEATPVRNVPGTTQNTV